MIGIPMKVVLCMATAALFASPEPKAPDKAGPTKKQIASRETLGLCTALMAWNIDNPPEAEYLEEGKASRVDLAVAKRLSHADLEAMLIPNYVAKVWVRDPWGHSYQVLRNSDARQPWSWAARSAGPDGDYCSDSYLVPQPKWDRCDDIVRVDGELVAGPEAPAAE